MPTQKRESKRRDSSRATSRRRVKGKAARRSTRWRPASVAAAILVTAAVALTAVLAAYITRDANAARDAATAGSSSSAERRPADEVTSPPPEVAARPDSAAAGDAAAHPARGAGAATATGEAGRSSSGAGAANGAGAAGGAVSTVPATARPSPSRRTAPSAARPPIQEPQRRVYKGSLIFVIDDVGYNMKELEPFLDLPFPLTIAVMPDLQYSKAAALAARKAGKEVILHQPMQAQGGQNPGPGAILLSMSREEATSVIERNLLSIPGVVGINNHMGSAASADLYLMEAVAEVAKNRGIYYLDSLTVLGTAMPEAARREGIRYWERDVFLDNAPDRASIIHAVEDGKKRASKDRPAVMIGHVWSAELAQTLSDLYPKLVDEGYSLSTISRFMLQEAMGEDDSPGD